MEHTPSTPGMPVSGRLYDGTTEIEGCLCSLEIAENGQASGRIDIRGGATVDIRRTLDLTLEDGRRFRITAIEEDLSITSREGSSMRYLVKGHKLDA